MGKHECSYCEETFGTDSEYASHLESTHKGELGAVDKRFVQNQNPDSGERSHAFYYGIAGVALLFGLVVTGLAVATLGGDGIHEHGTLEIVVDGEPIDLTQDQYVHEGENQNPFHFHGDDGEVWHLHPDRQTLEESMDDLGIEVTESSVTVDGETYDDSDPETSVSVTVNGESVNPQEYEIEGVEPVEDARDGAGDDIEIVVEGESES